MIGNSSWGLHMKNFSADTEKAAAQNTSDQDCLQRSGHVEKAIAYSSILVVSFVGNLLVLIIFYKNRQLRRSPTNFFVFNMALSDLFNPLTILPIKVVEIISGSDSWKVSNPWLLGNILCKVCYFLPDVSLLVSIQTLLLISCDRLLAVVFPLKASLISSKVRLTAILCTWLVASAIHAPYFYVFQLFSYQNEAYCKQHWGQDHLETFKKFVTATYIIFLMVPFILLVFLYGTIAWTLIKNNKRSQRELSCIQRQRNQQLRKTIRMSAAIIIAFFICLSPVIVYMFTTIFIWNWNSDLEVCLFQTVISFFSFFMLHAWSAINPCICLICINIYRRSLVRILPFSSGVVHVTASR
ncbi:growth hormone secretagogue receptor type 1-like [Stylophora pistillata]|uniref:growth hormone secretagogue receptor type 1-like n=1 Tax=Stylophora pistillata TaxID=50429 RepID=UPI000C04069B|nr:growth hormone secretagogue receptor type 1-like [Stylophora pistillata]